MQTLIAAALAAHRDAVEQAISSNPSTVTLPWVLNQIEDHQTLCEPAHILSIARAAIKNGTVEAYNQGGILTHLPGATEAQFSDLYSGLAKVLGISNVTYNQAVALYWVTTGTPPNTAYSALASLLKPLGDASPFDTSGKLISSWKYRAKVLAKFQETDIRIKAELDQTIGIWLAQGVPASTAATVTPMIQPAAPEMAPAPPLPSHFGIRIVPNTLR